MKKILVLLIFLVLSSFAKEDWEYVANCISIDKNSIQNENKYKSAQFKIEIANNCNSYRVNDKRIDYVVSKYLATCDNKKLLKQINVKAYDYLGNLIKDNVKKNSEFLNYEKFSEGEIFYNTICHISKYDKSQTISFNDYLNLPKKKSDILKLNQNNDVIFNNKVILTTTGYPLNIHSAYTYTELKILFTAQGIKPRKNCNPNDTAKNGALGCYMDIP